MASSSGHFRADVKPPVPRISKRLSNPAHLCVTYPEGPSPALNATAIDALFVFVCCYDLSNNRPLRCNAERNGNTLRAYDGSIREWKYLGLEDGIGLVPRNTCRARWSPRTSREVRSATAWCGWLEDGDSARIGSIGQTNNNTRSAARRRQTKMTVVSVIGRVVLSSKKGSTTASPT